MKTIKFIGVLILFSISLLSTIKAYAQNKKSLIFGVGDHAGIVVGPSLCNFTSLTVEFWYYQNVLNTTDRENLVGKLLYDNDSTGFSIGSMYLQGFIGGRIIDKNGNKIIWPGITCLVDTWYHHAMCYDKPTNTFRYFINGILQYSTVKSLDTIGSPCLDIVINSIRG